MVKPLFILFSGIFLAILTIGGYFTARTLLVRADPQATPVDVLITRTSPTAAEIKFKTEKETIASIDCTTSKDEVFTLCSAETTPTTEHAMKTSIILDPEKEYFFRIKIGEEVFDNLGVDLIIPKETLGTTKQPFPDHLLGTCSESETFDTNFDINKDGCIRANDRILYEQ